MESCEIDYEHLWSQCLVFKLSSQWRENHYVEGKSFARRTFWSFINVCKCVGFGFIYGEYLQFSNYYRAHPNCRLLEIFLSFPNSITTIASARCRRNYKMGNMIWIQAITDPCWVHLYENKQVEQAIERIIGACHPHQSCNTSEQKSFWEIIQWNCESSCMRQSGQ